MSILFDDASSEYLSSTTSPIKRKIAFSMGCWFNSDAIGASQSLMDVGQSADANRQMNLVLGGSGNVVARSRMDTAFESATSTSTVGANEWHHAGAIFGTNGTVVNARTVILDGVVDTGSVVTQTYYVPTDIVIGVLVDSTPDSYMSGKIAHAAVWTAELVASEWELLAAGVSPLLIRPNELIVYWPLSNIYDLGNKAPSKRKNTLINNGASSAINDGPRILEYYDPNSPILAANTQRQFFGGAVVRNGFMRESIK